MGRRDPRANRLEEDPFSRTQPSDQQRSISVQAPALAQALQSLWGMQFTQPVRKHQGKLWHFSEEEKQHLMLATGAFTLALGFMAANGLLGLTVLGLMPWVVTVIVMMPIMLIAVGPAFVLHEIGHKLVARHYGCWAEFRADPQGLKFGVGLAFVLGFLFMAPGAVMVAGRVTRRQNGHIAAAGPLVNLGLFLIGLPAGALLLALSGATGAEGSMVDNGALNWKVLLLIGVQYWLVANLVLGLFNMLPFGPLDGRKVLDWSPPAFYALFCVFAIPIICWWFLQLWSPMMIVEYLANLF